MPPGRAAVLVRGFGLGPLLLRVRRSLMDGLARRDRMCHLVLWVLGSHWRRLSARGQPSPKDRLLLRGLMCHLVLGHHLRQPFHLVPLFLTVRRSLMDRLPLRDLMCHLVLWVLCSHWLRLSPMGQPSPKDRLLLRGLLCHLVLCHPFRQPFHLVPPSLTAIGRSHASPPVTS